MTREQEAVCDKLFRRLLKIKNDDDFVKDVVTWAFDIDDQRELIRFIDEEPDNATPENIISYAVYLGTDRDGFFEDE